jgi:hypothetical protein
MKVNLEISFKEYSNFEDFIFWLGETANYKFDIINAPKSWYKRLNE